MNSVMVMEKGDVDEGFKQAVHISEDTLEPMQHIGFLEPHSCTVSIEADGKTRVWSCVKIPFSMPGYLSQATGVPAEQFVIMPTPIGGDFGGKGYLMDEACAYFLARASGQPVQMVMSMNKEFQGGGSRDTPRSSGSRAEWTRTGGWWHATARCTGTAGHMPPTAAARVCLARGACPARMPSRTFASSHAASGPTTCPCGSMRAPGQPQVTFACESHTDMLARRIGVEPIDFRRRNVVHHGDVLLDGDQIQSDAAITVLERAIAALGATVSKSTGARARAGDQRARQAAVDQRPSKSQSMATDTYLPEPVSPSRAVAHTR